MTNKRARKGKPAETLPDHERFGLTTEEAARIARYLWHGLDITNTLGDFLLLIRALACEPAEEERDALRLAIDNALKPYVPGVDDLVDSFADEARAELRKGGAA